MSALDVDSVGPHDFELSNTVTNVWSRGDEEFDLLNIGVRQSRCVWSDDLQRRSRACAQHERDGKNCKTHET